MEGAPMPHRALEQQGLLYEWCPGGGYYRGLKKSYLYYSGGPYYDYSIVGPKSLF